MKTLVTILFLSLISTAQAQISTTDSSINANQVNEKAPMKKSKKKNFKRAGDVKTNGEITTSGCETASGKKITENEQGYDECRRQIGTK